VNRIVWVRVNRIVWVRVNRIVWVRVNRIDYKLTIALVNLKSILFTLSFAPGQEADPNVSFKEQNVCCRAKMHIFTVVINLGYLNNRVPGHLFISSSLMKINFLVGRRHE